MNRYTATCTYFCDFPEGVAISKCPASIHKEGIVNGHDLLARDLKSDGMMIFNPFNLFIHNFMTAYTYKYIHVPNGLDVRPINWHMYIIVCICCHEIVNK